MNIAIQSATAEQKARLKDRLDAYTRLQQAYAREPDDMDLLEEIVAADFAFHCEIIRMSGNRLYLDVYQMVQNAVRGHIRHLLYTRAHAAERDPASGRSHQAIYDSIVNGDAETARQVRERMLGVVPAHGPDYYADGMPAANGAE